MEVEEYKSRQEYWARESEKQEKEFVEKIDGVFLKAKDILSTALVSGLITIGTYYTFNKVFFYKNKGKKSKNSIFNKLELQIRNFLALSSLVLLKHFLTQFLKDLDE